MNKEVLKFTQEMAAQIPDDIAALSQVYALPKLNYVDISRQEQLVQMMQRWPLLAELAQGTVNK